jgi:hypothetical protein
MSASPRKRTKAYLERSSVSGALLHFPQLLQDAIHRLDDRRNFGGKDSANIGHVGERPLRLNA